MSALLTADHQGQVGSVNQNQSPNVIIGYESKYSEPCHA